MKNSAERIQFISDYIFSYENKIKELNKQGLFNDAKLFELFASNVGQLYLGLKKPLINLNVETSTFPCVDLFSEDGNVFCQASTCQNVPSKISTTLNNINNSKNEKIKSIKEVYFIVLNNESIAKVKDLTLGSISFVKTKNLITTGDIINKATNDLSFQESLYELLKKDDYLFESEFKKFQEAMEYDSKSVLNDIDEFINKEYYIDLSEQINRIISQNDKFVLISGEAGSGKSVLCKKILEKRKNVLCARAEKLVEAGDVNKIWDFNIKDTISLIRDNVYIYIDALEFIADNRNKIDVLNSLLERLKDLDNAYLLCSCRSSDLGSFIRTISKYNIVEYKTTPINEPTLKDISNYVPVLSKIISNSKYNSLLTSPFYINFLTRLDDFNSIKDENQLRRKIWKEIICLNDNAIEAIITKIVLERATKFVLYSDSTNYDTALIEKLLSNGVLIRNENGIRLKYDIFEDICFEQYIDNYFDLSKGDYLLFFKNLENVGRCIYRRYQIWIENKLFSKINRKKFLYTLVATESIPELWKQQSIIGIIKSTYCKEFFEEYSSELVDKVLLTKFIDITNIYGFELDNISFTLGTFILKNKGCGRESLIKIIYQNEIYKKNINDEAIKKLIFDYTNLITDKEISSYSFEILKYYIEEKLKIDYSYDLIKKEVESIYKLYEVSDSWIIDFFELLKKFVCDEKEELVDFAFDALKDALSINGVCLIKKYSNYIKDFFDIYYTTIKKEKDPFYQHYHDELNRNILFGLNENADNYDHESFNDEPKYFSPLLILLKQSFWPTFKWYLEFVNKCVETFKTNVEVYSYKIYHSKDNIKEYVGTGEMWMTGEYQNNMPTLLSDMTFIVKSLIINIIKTLDDKNKSVFANNIKHVIYENSNNIIGLSIISNVGLTFPKELPGYCLELVSSLELVLNDLSRYGLTLDNPTRKMLEKEMAKKVGLPELPMDRYNSINPKEELRKYTVLSQFNYPNLRDKYFEIFDYLYSTVQNDEEHATLYLQLQQMDIRNYSINELDSHTFEFSPKIEGAAKDISDVSNEKTQAISSIVENITKVTSSIKNQTITVDEIDAFIQVVLENESDPLSFQYNNILIASISFALTKLDIDSKKRNEYCSLWIKYANKQLNNETIIIDAYFYQILFNQLNEEIDIQLKNEIKTIILDLLIKENNNDGTRYQIFNVAKNFLISNKKYGTLYRNTLFLLAEDEMNHQIFNYKYLCKYHKKETEEFIPNMQPRLNGVDFYIEQDGRKKYGSKKDDIINKYLFEEKEYDYSNVDISHLDVRLISYVFCCGLNIDYLPDKKFIHSYLEQLIEIYNKKTYYSHDIVGYYGVLEVEDYFKKCLLDSKKYSTAIEILFDKADYSKFTRETLDFYLNILASMTAFYFDSYDSKDKRKHVENVIHLMEKYINAIPFEFVKNELTKALILAFGRFGGAGDWSKCKTNYAYSDKAFLNEIFSKYGYLHFYDLLSVINHLQYKKLLPEILIAIHYSFKKYVRLKKNRSDELEKIISFINQIMYYSFVNYESEIKGDNDLIVAFEGILLSLIELKDEKSAVLLDEFRIH